MRALVAAAAAAIAILCGGFWLKGRLNRPLPPPPPPPCCVPDDVALPGYLRNNRQSHLLLFLHGFSSSPRDAWQHQDGAYWPTVFQNDPRFDSFDIYVAGYPTCSAERPNEPLGTLHEFVERGLDAAGVFQYDRIVIVAHSMGGLVARAMVLNDVGGSLRKRIGALVFLGTPGRGTPKADVLGWLAGRCGARQAADLAVDSNYIQFTNSLWQKTLVAATPAFPIVCAAEDKALRGWESFGPLVPYESAAANCGNTAERMTGEDHFDIAKVAGRDAEHEWLGAKILTAVPAPSSGDPLDPVTHTPLAYIRPTWTRMFWMPPMAEVWVDVALTGRGLVRRGRLTAWKTLAPSRNVRGRFEGDLVLTSSEPGTRLSNLTARCVRNCGTAPRSVAAGVAPSSPGFGQRPRWIGVSDGTDGREAGAGITHWRLESGPAPVWELSGDVEAEVEQRRVAPETHALIEDGVFRMRVPAGAQSAIVRLTLEGQTYTYDVINGVPPDAPFEIVRAEPDSEGTTNWVRWTGGPFGRGWTFWRPAGPTSRARHAP